MRTKNLFFSAASLSLGLYILFPTADELFVHPSFGMLLAVVLNMPYPLGILLSMVIYRAIGVTFIAAALISGGKPICNRLKQVLKKTG